MKTEIFEHYSNILDNLISVYDFAKYYFQNPFTLDNGIREGNLKIVSGSSRGCIIDTSYDWVVKYDLEGCGVNTCEKEEHIYEAAMRNSVEKFFVEAIYLGTYCRSFEYFEEKSFEHVYCHVESFMADDFMEEVGEKEEEGEKKKVISIELPLYAYRRANAFFPESILDVGKVRKKLGVSPLTEKHIVVGHEFSKAYTEEEYKKLVAFLEKEGINDLHCGNVGMINGKPVLIDYCGYEEDYSW